MKYGPTEKRKKLVNARSLHFEGLDSVYWRVAQVLEDPQTRDLTTAQFIQAYLLKFPRDATNGAIAEAIRRYRADLQNIVAPDIYPHSASWVRKSERHQDASREFYREETGPIKREDIAQDNPFPGLLKLKDGEFKLSKWIARPEFDRVNDALRTRGFHYAGSGVWKR